MKKIKIIITIILLTSIILILLVFARDKETVLVAHYPFNANSNDESVNNFHGIINGAQLTKDRFGKENKAFYFNGLDNFIKIDNEILLQICPQKTISTWIYIPKKINKYQTIIEKGSTNEGWEYGLYLNSRNKVRFVIYPYSGISEYSSVTSKVNLKTERWYHILGIFNDNSNISLYINNEIDNYSLEFNENYKYSKGTSNLTIGIRKGWGSHADPTYQFNGKIDDIRIYNNVLSEEEITKLYTEKND